MTDSVRRTEQIQGPPGPAGVANQFVFGAVLVSGNIITPTNPAHHVSGTGLLKTINVPGFPVHGLVIFIPDGAWTADTSGNIGAAFSAVAGVPVLAVWDGTKWWLR